MKKPNKKGELKMEKEEYALSKSMLSCMGSDVVYCGTSGSGSKMKIINIIN